MTHELTTVDERPLTPVDQVPASPLRDLRSAMMSLPTEVMALALAEYSEKRKIFRDWLKSQMKQGIHFGYPPGCEPRGGIDPLQWTHKPSLYKAGAEFVIDLCWLRQEYFFDSEAATVFGGQSVVYKCTLYSKATGSPVGDGCGAAKFGEKKGTDTNKAVKDACKRAMVAAVLNSFGLSDLFTQDLEDMGPREHDNPEPQADAPQEQPRGPQEQLATAEQWQSIRQEWAKQYGKSAAEGGTAESNRKAFAEFVHSIAPGVPADRAWPVSVYRKIAARLGMPVEGQV